MKSIKILLLLLSLSQSCHVMATDDRHGSNICILEFWSLEIELPLQLKGFPMSFDFNMLFYQQWTFFERNQRSQTKEDISSNTPLS